MNSILRVFVAYFIFYIIEVNALESEERDIIEARGKGKYALLTHLAIVLAAKIGLYKIFLGIALVVAAVKAMVVMAWALAVSKYVPDFWPHYKNNKFPNYNHRHVSQTPSNALVDLWLSSFKYDRI